MEKNKISQFKILCFEIYRKEKNMSLEEAILLFDDYQVFTFIGSCFEEWKNLEITEISIRIDEYINSKR